jgi:hypothetical protein
VIRCRYLRRNEEQCTAEALDSSPDAEIVICQKHAAAVLDLVNARLEEKR